MYQPRLDVAALAPQIARLEAARREILEREVAPVLARWLAQDTEVRGAHMSTRIEGNPLTEAEVRATLASPPAAPDASQRENLDYRMAGRLARQLAGDPSMDVDGGLVRALHFLCVRSTDPHGTAGQYRVRQNQVGRGRRVYVPPHPSNVPGLMDDLVRWLRERRGTLHPLILAAAAHLEFVSIHPFDDGNGRTARALTLYFVARGDWLFRDMVSSEEVFGGDVAAYYDALQSAQGDRYPGQASEITPWLRWFLDRLAEEAETTIGALRAYPETIAEIAAAYLDDGDPGRVAHALMPIALFGELTSAEYAAGAGVSRPTAVHDLNHLVDAGVLRRVGAGPATRYVSARPFTPLRREDLRQRGGLAPAPSTSAIDT
jgi:Fic family protein